MTGQLPTADTKYDRELGRVSALDREYAVELLADLDDETECDRLEIVAAWLRKARYEAVMADRKHRAALKTAHGETP